MHTHAPLTHVCPVAQATQASPPVPQAPADVPASHVVPLQQPVAQSAALQYAAHAPLTHSVPAAQATHAAPSLPHALLALPASHVVPLQQPVAQSDESQ